MSSLQRCIKTPMQGAKRSVWHAANLQGFFGQHKWQRSYRVKTCTVVYTAAAISKLATCHCQTILNLCLAWRTSSRMPRNKGAQPPWINRAQWGISLLNDATRRGFRTARLRKLDWREPFCLPWAPELGVLVSLLPPSTKGEDPMVWYDR